MRTRRAAVAAVLAAGIMLGLTAPAQAERADGVCGGVGTWDPVTQACVQ
jgi:hypothetical protein